MTNSNKSMTKLMPSVKTKPKPSVKIKNNIDAKAAFLANYKDSLSFFKTVQIPLQSIIRDNVSLDIINSYVIMVSRVMNHVSLFFKLFILTYFKHNIDLPVINVQFISDIARTICKHSNSMHNVDVPDGQFLVVDKSIDDFFHNIYLPTMEIEDYSTLDFNRLTQCLQYEAGTFITSLETHISEHFYDMFDHYCNTVCYLDELMELCDKIKDVKKRNSRKNEFRTEFRHMKNDILNGTKLCDDAWASLRDSITQNIFNGSTQTLKNDVHKNPLSLLKILIKMSQEAEEIMYQRYFNIPEGQKPGLRIINVFPLKTSLIPGYIPFDSHMIATILFNKPELKVIEQNKDGNKEERIIKKGNLTHHGDLLKYNYEIWNTVFKMNHKVFNLSKRKKKKNEKKGSRFKKDNYIFSRRISTDGFGCSILFLRKDKYKSDAKSWVKPVKKPFGYREDMYIDDLPESELNRINLGLDQGTLSLTANDPGYNDIAYFTDGDTKVIRKDNGKYCMKTNKLRYTQNQRRFETKSKVYSKRRANKKKKTFINGMSIEQIESALSRYNANTCDFDNFYDYVIGKNTLKSEMQKYYNKNMHRYLKWSSKINRRRTDDKLINRFKEKFGGPEKVILLYGDQAQHGMRFKEPTKGKSMRRLFKRHGYKVYLVDEFRTSMMLYDQPGPKGEGVELEKFCKMNNPKPKKKMKPYYNAHGKKVEKKSSLCLKTSFLRWKEIVVSHELLRSKIFTRIQPIKVPEDRKDRLIPKDSKMLDLELMKEAIKEGLEVIYTQTIINRNLNASLNILQKGKRVIEGKEREKRFERKKHSECNQSTFKGLKKDQIITVELPQKERWLR